MIKAKGHTVGNSIIIAENDGLFYMLHGDITYMDEALYENKLSVVFEDISAARETLDRVRDFVRNHPTVYCGTHTPQGYENLESNRVIDLNNPVPTVLAEVDFSAQKAYASIGGAVPAAVGEHHHAGAVGRVEIGGAEHAMSLAPVPVEGADGKVLYVWFDAPIGYISNTKELCDNEPERWGSWEKWWQDEDTRLLHFIGKDNIVFHCIIFPTMMKAHGSYVMPDNVPSNEFLNLEDDKISTSRNWAVWLHEYLVDFPGKQDVLRYVLTANAPETKDNNFTWRDFQSRNNNELVAVYGNFVNRALVLTHKYFDGKVPACGALTEYDKATIAEFMDVKAEVEKLLDTFKFREAQKEAMNLARIGNKYLADTEPWKLAKTDMERVGTILNLSLQLAANLAIAFEPFLPFSSEKLRGMLGMETFEWNQLGSTDLLAAGHQLGKAELLFEKIEDSAIDAQMQRLEDIKKANEAANYKANPVKPTVSFEDWEKLDIRVGTVLECERVPKMKKLLKFKIADGLADRTIVSGIAEHYAPEELVGKQVLFIANFAPRQFKNGLVSEGMILSAENYDGSLAVTSLLREVKPGSEVK